MKVLELGAGKWRYTLFFADNGFQVQALDYSEPGVRAIQKKYKQEGFLNQFPLCVMMYVSVSLSRIIFRCFVIRICFLHDSYHR